METDGPKQVEEKVDEISEEVVGIFDLLARLDFKDAKRHQLPQKGFETGSSVTVGEPVSGS